jgi:hypothetical protein
LIPGLLTYADYVRREVEWDLVKKTTRLYGRFYEGDQALLFPVDWLDRSMDRRRWEGLDQNRKASAMGVDVAAGGRDRSCWTLADTYGVIEQIVRDTPNTMEICGLTIRLMKEHSLSPARVAIDAGGGGKQIADRLVEQKYRVQTIGFGEGADDKQAFKNRRAELYGCLRKLLDPEREDGVFALPPNGHELRHELAILPLQYDSEGKLFLPPKDRAAARAKRQVSLRELLGRSPDRADSLALAAWALRQPTWSNIIEGELLCSGYPDDDFRPLTALEIATLPPSLRSVLEGLYDDDDDSPRGRHYGADWLDERN